MNKDQMDKVWREGICHDPLNLAFSERQQCLDDLAELMDEAWEEAEANGTTKDMDKVARVRAFLKEEGLLDG